MNKPLARPSLLQRALGVFVVLALCLGAFLWAGKTFVQRSIQRVQLDTQRMAALRTFESAIVPRSSMPDYAAPNAERVRHAFLACADPLKDAPPAAARAAEAAGTACAGAGQVEELACYLRAVDARLADMGGGGRANGERMLKQVYAVDVARWAQLILMTQGQKDSATPIAGDHASRDAAAGRRQRVSCHDAMAAARQMSAHDGRLLAQLGWRDLTSMSVASKAFESGQAMKVPDRALAQHNPWEGVPGCVYFGGGAAGDAVMVLSDRRTSNRQACTAMRPKGAAEKDLVFAAVAAPAGNPAARDAAWAVPASLPVILADLDHVRIPGKELYRAYTEAPHARAQQASLQGDAALAVATPHGPNELERRKRKVEAGFNVHLTIEPATQRAVQQVAACYAGDHNACAIAGLESDGRFVEFTRRMYETAAVRMAAVAVIDIASGKIEALGSAHSECYREEYDGPGRDARRCPDLPTTPHYEPERLLNHALYTDALPASTIKPVMAVGFMQDHAYRSKILADRVSGTFTRLQDELKGSDSAAFLDRMFCKDQGYANCHRPGDVLAAALLMGWDAGCAAASARCGRLDVLFGLPGESRVRPDTSRLPLGASVIYGRLLTEPASVARQAQFRAIDDFSFDPRLAAECSRGEQYSGDAKNHAWRKCRAGHFSKIEHEGWGQGNARATAVGEAGMMARLAAAGAGRQSQRLPHLVERISDSKADDFDLAVNQFHLADPVRLAIPQADAAFILDGMISHKSQGTPDGTRTGTAFGACARVFGAAACNRIDWIAGKTGTPPYGNDELTLSAIRRKCSAPAGERLAAAAEQEWDAACSSERPYKWYVAVFQSKPGVTGFDKAIAVLTERNWYRLGPLAGKVQSPGDHDELNVSAEIAFRIMDRLRGRRAPGAGS